MNKVICILFLLGIVKIAISQQDHFVYIQADDKQQFTVQVNNKDYTSSSIGYVIIPKLKEGDYQFNISFPSGKYTDQIFNFTVGSSDAGFALKNYGEKGWGLFNYNTLDIVMAGNKNGNATVAATKPNAFGEMLSNVVNDSTIQNLPENITVDSNESMPANENTNSDNIAANNIVEQNNNVQESNEKPAEEKPEARSSIIKLHQQKTKKGTEMVFLDPATGENIQDTIRILLPSGNQENIVVVKTEESPQNENADQSNQAGNINNPFYDSSEKSVASVESQAEPLNKAPANSSTAFREECDNMFTGSELDKLRKKMISANSDEKMTQIAQKAIGKKCVISKQVKSLGPLFLSDDARYKFFNAIYPNVYDIGAFALLEDQLIDPNYKNLFRAMLK